MSSSSNNSHSNSSNSNSSSNNNTIHQHLHSPSKLTEFARNFEDKPDSLFGRVVNKIQNVYNQSYNTVNDISSGTSSSVQVGKSRFYDERKPSIIDRSTSHLDSDNTQTSSSSSLNAVRPQPPTTLKLRKSSETQSSSTTTTMEETAEANERIDQLPGEANQVRTVSNVVKHISSIVASKNNNVSAALKMNVVQIIYLTSL